MNEPNENIGQVPVKCQVCGRQDDTVRYVSYPFVLSFVVLTFQRAFTGCWCRFHRIQRWFAAGFITSVFGWLGIPFGIVLTPARLLQLARGGLQDNVVNGQILRQIGELRQQNGDVSGAIRCFEASLGYVDDPVVNEQLRSLYMSQTSYDEPAATGLTSFFVFPMISIIFALIGVFVGLLDFIVRWFSGFLPAEISIFVLILLQVPFVIFVYFCVAFLSYMLQPAVRLTRVNSAAFLFFAGIVISIFFLNGIIAGEAYGIYTSYFLNGVREGPRGVFSTLTAILTRSGTYFFNPASFTTNFLGNALFAVLLSLSALLLILVLAPRVKFLAVLQDRISRLRGPSAYPVQSASIFGWAGLVGLVACFTMLFIATPQMTTIDALEAFDHISFGYEYSISSQPEQAIAEFQAAIELKPEIALAHILLGKTYLSLVEAEEAHESFLTASTLEPANPVVHNGIGWSYYQLGKYDLAKNEFLEALNIDPQNLEAHLGMGLVYLNLWNLEESRRELQGVIDISPEIPDAHLGLGTLQFIAGNYDSATKSFDMALKLNPNTVDAYVYKGIMLYRQDKYSEAESAFNAALKIVPNHYDALSGLGDLRIAHYDFKGGMNYYDKAIASNPDRVDAYLDKAGILGQVGEYDDAISLLEPLVEKDARIAPTLSYLYYLKGDDTNGKKLLNSAISFANDLTGFEKGQGYITISGVETALANFDKAENYARLAEDIFPVGLDSSSYFYLARLYSAMGDQILAKESILKGSELGHSEITMHLVMAELAINQEKLDEAERELQATLKIDDTSSNAHAMLSFVFFQNENLPRASLEARSALKLNPYNAYAHSQLAFVYYAQGNVNEALDNAQEAVHLNRLQDISHYILGVCYMETGDTEEAITEFEQFLDLYWDRAYVRDYKINTEEYLDQLRQTP